MPHTFTNLLTHVIFSTKDRKPVIAPGIKERLHAYMCGIIREMDGKTLKVNGTADHVHLLLWMPPALSVSETLRVLKANSSRWMNQEFRSKGRFAWQTGYAAFTVSHSNAPSVVKYIADQERHHRRLSFHEELVGFLKKNGISYDERYLL
jgi:REP-associated tyrosine transposase